MNLNEATVNLLDSIVQALLYLLEQTYSSHVHKSTANELYKDLLISGANWLEAIAN